MEIIELREHLDRRLDELRDDVRVVEAKLDNHVGRIASAETSITWLRGSIQIGVSILLAVITGMATIIWNSISK